MANSMQLSERRSEAARLFREAFGEDPHGVVFAPGRVNLIGEHIDYHGGPVLPAALSRGITVAWRPCVDSMVRVLSVDSVQAGGRQSHTPVQFDMAAIGERDPSGGWGNYLRAAGLWAKQNGFSKGADLLVTSDLPEASGLSSSSALVVATGMALLESSDALGRLDNERRLQLATEFAKAEHYVGTAGGGMDQAASLGGIENALLRIEFKPLRWSSVPFPDELRLIVAHTGVRAEKSGEAMARYNHIRGNAHNPQIAEHVRSEVHRVEEFEVALRAPNPERCGALMNQSHASLRDLLQVSHPALDHLAEVALKAGALGARMTGAGFGGSIVALASAAAADQVTAALRMAQSELNDSLPAFITHPGAGATSQRLT